MSLDERVVPAPNPEISGCGPSGWVLAVPVAVLALLLSSLAGVLAGSSTPALALILPVVLVPVWVWAKPRIVVYLLFAASVTVEQSPYAVGPRSGAATANIPLFQGALPAGVNPAELLLLLGLLVVLMQAVRDREAWLYRTPVQLAMRVVIVFVGVYLVLGLARGGSPHMAVWEVRPFFYLLGAFLLSAALIERFSDVRPLLWILVLGSGAKAFYGILIFLSVRNVSPRPESILAHEESFFFGLYIFATVAMWLFQFKDRLRTVATLLLPLVLVANMVNSRRTAWLILMAGVGVIGIIVVTRVRQRRRLVASLMAVAAVGAAVYLPLFWNKQGTLAQPARAIRSVVAPDERDLSSNVYREIENYNLETQISQTHSTGAGFGIPIQYFGLVDLVEEVPMLAYVPHNGVLYLWWRMGALGVTAFAVLVAQVVISGARLAGARNREVAMFGAITAAATVGYVAMGAVDMGFFWFRNALAMGTLMGVTDALSRQVRAEEEKSVARDDEAGVQESAAVGSPWEEVLADGPRS